MSAMARSLDELEAFCRDRGVRLALENATRWADYQTCIIPVMEARPPEYVGFCYDSGHHNIDMIRDDRERAGKNEARDRLADRLLAVHLHDNNGFGDQHLLPFRGSVDWDEVAGFLVRANYTKPLNLEVNLTGLRDRPVEDYVRLAHQCAVRLEKMIN